MKTVDLTTEPLSVADLLRLARSEVVLVKTEEGDSFVISPADDFETEVQLLRRHHGFLSMLDAFKKEETVCEVDITFTFTLEEEEVKVVSQAVDTSDAKTQEYPC